MKFMTRRQAIGGLAALTGAGVLGLLAVRQAQGSTHLIVGDAPYIPVERVEGYRNFALPIEGSVKILNLSNAEIKSIPVPFLPHGFSFESNQNLALACEKWGPNAAIIDLKSLSVKKLLRAPEGSTFFGHGCFLGIQQKVVISGQASSGDGQLFIFDSTNGYQLADTISLPRKLHEVQALDDHRVLVAINGKSQSVDAYQAGQGAIQIVDVTARTVGKFWPVSEASHLLKLGPNEYAVSGSVDYSADLPVSVVNLDSGVVQAASNSGAFKQLQFKGEGLSLGKIARDEFVVSVPISRELLIWNFKQGRFINTPVAEQPLGIYVLSEKEFVVSTAAKNLYRYEFDSKRGILSKPTRIASGFGNGRHVYEIPKA